MADILIWYTYGMLLSNGNVTPSVSLGAGVITKSRTSPSALPLLHSSTGILYRM